MIVKLLTKQYLEFLSLKGGCTALSESTLVKMPQCWKSHVTADSTHVCQAGTSLNHVLCMLPTAVSYLRMKKKNHAVTGVSV